MTAFAKGILSNFVSKVLVAAIGLVTVILVSKYLGAEGRGIIGLFMSSVALLQLFCDFGNSTAIINLSYRHSNRNLWLSSLIWVAIVCISSYLILLFFPEQAYWWLIPPAAFIYSLINLNHLILMGNRKVHQRNLSLLVFPILLMLGFLLFSNIGSRTTVNYIVALFIALLVSGLVSTALIKKVLTSDKHDFRFENEILKKGFWIQSAQATQFLNYRLNFFLVSYFLGDFSLGVYNNAIILCESIWILGHSIAQMQHMKILNTEGLAEHFKITNRMILLNFIGTVILFIALISIPGNFWIYLFGDEFEPIRRLFPSLAAGVISFSISNIINHSLHAADKFKVILISNLTGLLAGLYVAVNYIPEWGLRGAAYSWSIGLTVSMLAYLIAYIWHFKSQFDVRNSILPLLFAVVLGLLMLKLLHAWQGLGLQFPFFYENAVISFFLLGFVPGYFSILGILNKKSKKS